MMLLRRITEHVKAQNWTAVALDFVIVVVGVFIGIQVSNWNDARGEVRLGEDYLRSFRQDLLADSQMLQTEIEARRTQQQDASIVLEFFDGRELNTNTFFKAYNRALRSRSMRPNRNTMDEVLNSGSLRLIRDAKIRTMLLDLYAMYNNITFLEEHIARDVDKYLYDTTFTSIPIKIEEPWIDNADNRAAAEKLLGDVTVRNGFYLIVANLDFNGVGLVADLEAAHDRVEALLEELPPE